MDVWQRGRRRRRPCRTVRSALSYDPDSHLLQTQQSANGAALRTANATYTPAGKPATATDANGNVTTSTYDIADRLARVTEAMGRATIRCFGLPQPGRVRAKA